MVGIGFCKICDIRVFADEDYFKVNEEFICEDCLKEIMKFELDDRVLHPVHGCGTVTVPTYLDEDDNSTTCVYYDNWPGQKFSVCCKTEELKLVKR